MIEEIIRMTISLTLGYIVFVVMIWRDETPVPKSKNKKGYK